MGRIWREIGAIEEDRLVLWFPVCLGGGILFYFSRTQEPSSLLISGLIGIITLLLLSFTRVHKIFWRCIGWGSVAFLLGFCASFYRTITVNPGMLSSSTGVRRFEGTICTIEQTSEAPLRQRLILDSLKISPSLRGSCFPQKVRLALRGINPMLRPGDRIRVRATVLPVMQAPSPLHTDFRRQAFFKGIGGMGFALTKPQVTHSGLLSMGREGIEHLRYVLTQRLLADLPSPLGSIAAALITGDTTSLPDRVRQDFANSGMSHILAISGLHLSIVAGFVFLVIQRGGALFSMFALRVPLHKIAAFLSIMAAFFYLILSGEGVPAKRSFLMTTCVMMSLIGDRRALSLRLVALAATIVLLTTPEALLGASFQLSFAAVISLIACYEISSDLKRRRPPLTTSSKGYSVFKYSLEAALSSLVASFATTPFGIVFFHQATLQAILSNMCAIPLVSFIIMPLAVTLCFSFLIHGEIFVFPLFEVSLKALLWIAQTVSDWPGACIKIPIGAPWGLSVFVWGGLWVCLWKSWIRWAGILFVVIGLWGVVTPHVPDFWIDAEGKVIGFFEKETGILWVSSLKRGTFVRKLWADASAAREVKEFSDLQMKKLIGPFGVRCCLINEKKRAESQEVFDLILSLQPLSSRERQRGTKVIDQNDLNRGGACVLWLKGPHVLTDVRVAYTHAGIKRPWVLPSLSFAKNPPFKKF